LQHLPHQGPNLVVYLGHPLSGLTEYAIAQGMNVQRRRLKLGLFDLNGGGHRNGFQGDVAFFISILTTQTPVGLGITVNR
jgi:hypothetical protein